MDSSFNRQHTLVHYFLYEFRRIIGMLIILICLLNIFLRLDSNFNFIPQIHFDWFTFDPLGWGFIIPLLLLGIVMKLRLINLKYFYQTMAQIFAVEAFFFSITIMANIIFGFLSLFFELFSTNWGHLGNNYIFAFISGIFFFIFGLLWESNSRSIEEKYIVSI